LKEEQFTHHISDTARWIAAYRALETKRKDAVFKDSLASRLAGKRGYEMVDSTPNTDVMAFAMIVRTAALDRHVYFALGQGVDTVINLGAGLDTRPYRLDLPSGLQWIEVDFPSLIQYKNEVLNGEKPVCNVQRIACDLANESERGKLFTILGQQTKKALIITEGVVGYLTNEQAASLSQSIHSIPTFSYWMMDYSQGKGRKNRYSKKLNKKLTHTPLLFTEANPLAFFGRHGWVVENNTFILDEADRIHRKMPMKFPLTLLMALFPKQIRELGNKTYGYVILKNDELNKL
jgi:methyltransferase (TIGR00027 family)